MGGFVFDRYRRMLGGRWLMGGNVRVRGRGVMGDVLEQREHNLLSCMSVFSSTTLFQEYLIYLQFSRSSTIIPHHHNPIQTAGTAVYFP